MLNIIGTCHWLCSIVPDSLQTFDCSPPGSSVHGILKATMLEWAVISSSRGLPDPGIEFTSPESPALAGFFTSEPPWKRLSLADKTNFLKPQGRLVVKNLPANAGDTGDLSSITGLGRLPRGETGNLLQYSCLGNPILCSWGPKESSHTHTHTHL